MQTTKRATCAQLRRVQRCRATERERAERARRVLASQTELIIDGVRQARTVAEIHDELTRPVVGLEFALQTARQLARTLQRLAARSLLTTPTTRGYPAEAAALCASLERQQRPHPRGAIDHMTERAAEALIDQALAASRKGALPSATGARPHQQRGGLMPEQQLCTAVGGPDATTTYAATIAIQSSAEEQSRGAER